MTAETAAPAVMLSKWWRTESAQNAIERAKTARQERFAKVRAQFTARQEKLKADVENWPEELL